MYGKHFASMYEGSMVGSGPLVFALMGYVIAKQEPDSEVGSQVDLNPVLLAVIFGVKEREVEEAIGFLCAPDPKSKSKEEEGRRLVRLGQFAYRVVNGAKYRAVRDQQARREQNRKSQTKFRQKLKVLTSGTPLPGEAAYVKAFESGEVERAERLAAPEEEAPEEDGE
jgi:hypothetical protein